mmetsp:Transcript_8279/g.12021  ORF Transcript_8279/g.12021 Transcript_8279/m.12021 type:complete len:333 (-) Transcript_8279:320-1318(-)
MAPKRNKNKRKVATKPLAPPPHASQMKSRKRARQVTTLFHKYTREKDLAIKKGASKEVIKGWDDKIEAMGGRKIYQEASQLSTSFHSTSKWVLGYLHCNGWVYGIPLESNNNGETSDMQKPKRPPRRDTKLLEVGAINTELLDASERTSSEGNKKFRLCVRAIDLHSMHPGRIEEADFNAIPLPPRLKGKNTSPIKDRYDVIVCSMVLNCVTTPEDRGEMLTRLYEFLRPGGKLFLTIPKLCLMQSPYIDNESFQNLLGTTGVGLKLVDTKESPKVSFFVCARPGLEVEEDNLEKSFHMKWTEVRKIKYGKKYRNKFAVVLDKDRVIAAKNG